MPRLKTNMKKLLFSFRHKRRRFFANLLSFSRCQPNPNLPSPVSSPLFSPERREGRPSPGREAAGESYLAQERNLGRATQENNLGRATQESYLGRTTQERNLGSARNMDRSTQDGTNVETAERGEIGKEQIELRIRIAKHDPVPVTIVDEPGGLRGVRIRIERTVVPMMENSNGEVENSVSRRDDEDGNEREGRRGGLPVAPPSETSADQFRPEDGSSTRRLERAGERSVARRTDTPRRGDWLSGNLFQDAQVNISRTPETVGKSVASEAATLEFPSSTLGEFIPVAETTETRHPLLGSVFGTESTNTSGSSEATLDQGKHGLQEIRRDASGYGDFQTILQSIGSNNDEAKVDPEKTFCDDINKLEAGCVLRAAGTGLALQATANCSQASQQHEAAVTEIQRLATRAINMTTTGVGCQYGKNNAEIGTKRNKEIDTSFLEMPGSWKWQS